MNEDYVSYEAAKLLKEKRFDWPCQAFYDLNGTLAISLVYTVNDELEDSDIACPTLYIAQKWLRDKKHTVVIVEIRIVEKTIKYTYRIIKKAESIEEFFYSVTNSINYNTYEEALQVGILMALDLI